VAWRFGFIWRHAVKKIDGAARAGPEIWRGGKKINAAADPVSDQMFLVLL
jgi:hypothetical protein